ncbi:MAG: hypothetical protein KC431_17700 [Myxococcales bacterium]|nr:hypothetical protein [Myxococcales bacterium]
MPRRPQLVLAAVALAGLSFAPACKRDEAQGSSVPQSSLTGGGKIQIQPAPEHLRGRVALPAGGRLYTRPTFSSPTYVLTLPDPPLTAGEAPPRARALRVVGVVSQPFGELSNVNSFVAVTNDLYGESEGESAQGCGTALDGLEHLRMLLYVPEVHLADVSTRPLDLVPFPGPSSTGEAREHVHIGAGARLGAILPEHGLPTPPAGSRWRWIDADGVRVLVPIPDDAVGKAWDPTLGPALTKDPGEALVRDAEGSVLWLDDQGGDSVELTLRNPCGEHRSHVEDSREVANLRALAEEVFYEQAPPREPEPAFEPDADYRVAAGTPLRWPDGDLAGEVLAEWSVAIGIGQNWDDRRCFDLPLGGELLPLDAPALACFAPDALEPLGDLGQGAFGRSNTLEVGGSIELGPAEIIQGEAWDEATTRALLNGHHGTVSECLRPLLSNEHQIEAARWILTLHIGERGSLEDVTVEALGPSDPGVEACLRAEVYTWAVPRLPGEVRVPVTLGPWAPGRPAIPDGDVDENADEADVEDAPPRPREPGKVFIIRDDEEDLEELGPQD